jgi:hypothetical protein
LVQGTRVLYARKILRVAKNFQRALWNVQIARRSVCFKRLLEQRSEGSILARVADEDVVHSFAGHVLRNLPFLPARMRHPSKLLFYLRLPQVLPTWMWLINFRCRIGEDKQTLTLLRTKNSVSYVTASHEVSASIQTNRSYGRGVRHLLSATCLVANAAEKQPPLSISRTPSAGERSSASSLAPPRKSELSGSFEFDTPRTADRPPRRPSTNALAPPC